MCDFDAELALFESEIAELDKQPSSEAIVEFENATTSSSPKKGFILPSPPKPPTMFPPAVTRQMANHSPFIGSIINPASVIPGGPGPKAASFFVPPQTRKPLALINNFGNQLAPPASCSTIQPDVIEGTPMLYKASAANSVPPQLLKTQALQSDIDKFKLKKQTDQLKKTLKDSQSKKKYVRMGGGETWEDPSLAEWDEKDFRIFCGDLGKEVSDEVLTKAFKKYPSFQKAKVVRESRTNKSKGYGFVSFRDSEDYARAMREVNGTYVGSRPIKLRKSTWKDRNIEVVKKKIQKKKQLGLF